MNDDLIWNQSPSLKRMIDQYVGIVVLKLMFEIKESNKCSLDH